MRIYTKTGDDSTTFHGGGRISKTDLVIHCQGEIDELNSLLGLVRKQFQVDSNLSVQSLIITCIQLEIEMIQRKLFDIGAQLNNGEQRVTEADITTLEKSIDIMEECLPELRNFILPDSIVHLARAVCRRAERSLAALMLRNPDDVIVVLIVPYLNRLSDYLFVLARRLTFTLGEKEDIWNGKKRD